jgi:oligopeptidase B
MTPHLPVPVAPKKPKEIAIHGDVRIDDYYWMRDREDPDTLEYLEAENAYTEAVLKPVKALEDRLYDEILARIRQTDLSVPAKEGSYYYYGRTEEGQQYPIFCRHKDAPGAPEEVLLDANVLAEGHSYFALGGFSVTDDHALLAYSVDFDGSETYTVHFKDLSTGELLDETIPETAAGLTWAGDNQTLFYATYDATHRPEHARRHRLGTDPANDPIVFTESDPQFTFDPYRTRSRKFVFIVSMNASKTSEVWYLDAYNPEGEFRVIEPRVEGLEYTAEHQGDRFLIRTNDGGATNFKLAETPLMQPGKEHWTLLIPESPDATIDWVDAFAGFFTLQTREDGLPRLAVHDQRTGVRHSIEFPEPTYDFHLEENREYATDLVRFVYTSLVTPTSVFDYNVTTRERELKKQIDVLGGYDAAEYQSERIHAPAEDGVLVPVSLVYRKGLERDGSNPLLLYAYGSYGLNSDPHFSHANLSLLDRGFVYAIAHIRGGSERGRSWFEDGRMLKKRNSFTDFIACGEFLIKQRYTTPSKMAAMGGSAGGLLMGAVANMRPDLFHALVARVPFVDVVTTMMDPTIPLTTGEYDQWGNPEEKLYYDYMLSYSPYDNVQRKDYPNILITTGLNDPRVAFWEPAKWTAKLRDMNTGSNIVLLKTNLGAGHGGASGRYEQIRETAFIYSFILRALIPDKL